MGHGSKLAEAIYDKSLVGDLLQGLVRALGQRVVLREVPRVHAQDLLPT